MRIAEGELRRIRSGPSVDELQGRALIVRVGFASDDSFLDISTWLERRRG